MSEDPWYSESRVTLPALIRGARSTYGAVMHKALDEVGCGDVPRNGIYVLGAIVRNGSPLAEIIRGLGVSKQAAGQLVDTLVLRGYLDRSPDPEDRRRMTVALTERGATAASACRAAADAVDTELAARVGADQVTATRATLAALIDIGRPSDIERSDHG